MAAIEEILRVVRLGGRVLIFVWALEQTGKRDFDKDVQDVFVPWAMPKKAEPKIKVKAPSRPQGVKKKDRKKSQKEGEEGEEEKEKMNSEVKETKAPLPAETTAVIAQALQEVSLDNKEKNLEEKPQEQEGARSTPADAATLSSSSSSSSSAQQQPQESSAAASSSTTSTPEAAPVYNRYYHLFQKGELEDLVTKTNKASIVQQGYDRDNWWCILEKTSN